VNNQLIGVGALNWNRGERITDRYGSVHLTDDGGAAIEFDRALEGKRGKLIAVVTKSRKSDHIGDLFRGIFPSQPDIGEKIELGEGWVFIEGSEIGLKPEPMRDTDWLNPEALYRCHQQTVELYFEEYQ
jgi:hypothetical protein